MPPRLPALPVFAAVLIASPVLAANPLPLKRVLLSTGGVGYFEHEATVTDDAEIALEVRRDQVDDVLKSIVIDDGQGGGTISLPGQEPLRELFRELPFGPEALESPVALLMALKGAEVQISGPHAISGRLLSVSDEVVALPGGAGTITRRSVAVMTEAGLRHTELEAIESLRFTDPTLQSQVNTALSTMAQHTARDRRRLTIRTTGQGPRTVRVTYVAAAPLWKATYRLTLPDGDAKVADLQGWAVLENMSGGDWNDVDLAVASGNPVTFRQALYSSYYVDRPEVPVEVMGRVLPRPDEGSVPVPPAAMRAAEAPPPPFAPKAAPLAGAPRPVPEAEPFTATPTETATQVTFRSPRPVSLPNGSSMLMPIVGRPVQATRIDLYQPGTQRRHPLAAVRLDNDTGAGLPPGVLTLYDHDGAGTAYVGDAQMPAIPPGEHRLLTFAVDQTVTVDVDEKPSRTLAQASIADGVLHLTVTERQTTTYTLAGPAGEARTVLIEHPRRAGWTLLEPVGARDVTPSAYRIPVDVPAGHAATVTMTSERPRHEQVSLADAPADRLSVAVAGMELPTGVREALDRLSALRATVAEQERRVSTITRDRDDTAKDQARLRENVQALPPDSDLARRTITKMGELEGRLERLDTDLAAARQSAEDAKRTLAEAVRGIKL